MRGSVQHAGVIERSQEFGRLGATVDDESVHQIKISLLCTVGTAQADAGKYLAEPVVPVRLWNSFSADLY